jgi:hypothetical protein
MSILYLPTSSLNFNNIFSTESISPASVYARRGFGYKRFEKVQPNPLDHALLLYGKVPVFEISDPERDNFPIVFAVEVPESQCQRLRERNGVTVFRTPATLYLTPSSATVLFRNEAELKQTVVASTRSLETKLVDLYKRRGCLRVQGSEPSFPWSGVDFADVPDEDETALRDSVRRDQRIDRMKGFLYAYVLGAYRTLPGNTVSLNHLARRIRNTVTSMLSGGNDAPPAQWDSLLDAILAFDRAFNLCDAATMALLSQLPLQHQKNGLDGFLKDVRGVAGADGYLRFINRLKIDRKLYCVGGVYTQLREGAVSSNTASVNDALLEMEQCVYGITQKVQGASRIQLSEESAATIFTGSEMRLAALPTASSVSSNDAPTIIALVDELTHSKYSVREFAASRLAIAKDCGLTIKGMVEDGQWQGSPTEKYVNGLLKNVGRGDAFDVSSTESLFLRSLAAFILKGDELEKLEDFLVSNAIGDFCVAFGFYGAFAGFAALPRTLTDPFYSMDDTDYLRQIYQGIHASLFGKGPSAELHWTSPPPLLVREPLQALPPASPAPQSEDARNAIREFEVVCKGRVSKQHMDRFRSDIAAGIIAARDCTKEFAEWLKESKKKPPKGATASLMARLGQLRHHGNQAAVDQQSPATPDCAPASLSSASNTKGKCFVDDGTCAKDLQSTDAGLDIVPGEVKKALSAKVALFQAGYGPTGFYAGDPKKYPRDNASAIDHFCRCLSSGKTKDMNLALSVKQKDSVVLWLKLRYGVRK